EAIRAGFSTPDLAPTPVELTHRGIRLVARKTLERLALGIEAEDGVGAEIGHPHLPLVIHINSVSMRPVTGKLVVGPPLPCWIIDAEISDVPLADPKTPLKIRPDASRAGVLRRRLDHRRLAGLQVRLAEKTTGKRHIIDIAGRRGSDAVRTDALGGIPDIDLSGRGIKPAINSGLSCEPDATSTVEGTGVELGAAA